MKLPKQKPAMPAIKPERIIPSKNFPYWKQVGQKIRTFFK